MFSFITVSAQAKNACSCTPIPSMKKYIGDARKKHIVGYSIDWTCTYKCKLDARDSDDKATLVTGAYHEYHVFPEDGSEGVCEGMVYKSHYNSMTNQYVYMYTGEDVPFRPTDSKSSDLKKWANTTYCE
ncbi:hypothetical protein [Bdellovibrio sp. HCB337]|uniref:hypothetical protein n=1 Tax=Bdellovibrio sp. HCB337 TaxID=3394358 RepID=UPI0039A55F70